MRTIAPKRSLIIQDCEWFLRVVSIGLGVILLSRFVNPESELRAGWLGRNGPVCRAFRQVPNLMPKPPARQERRSRERRLCRKSIENATPCKEPDNWPAQFKFFLGPPINTIEKAGHPPMSPIAFQPEESGMSKWNRYHSFFGEERTVEFEQRVNAAVESAVRELDKLVDDEMKIQYVTHVFAKTLDQLADWLSDSKMIN